MAVTKAWVVLALAIGLPALRGGVASGSSVWASPFKWDTVQDKLYSFCYGDDGGPLSPTALKALGTSKM